MKSDIPLSPFIRKDIRPVTRIRILPAKNFRKNSGNFGNPVIVELVKKVGVKKYAKNRNRN